MEILIAKIIQDLRELSMGGDGHGASRCGGAAGFGGGSPDSEVGSCGYVVYLYFLPAAVERFLPEVVTM